jgi:hypothetical protein
VRRGLHFPARTDRPVPTIGLRPFGIAGEIKGVRSIVAAPGLAPPRDGQPLLLPGQRILDADGYCQGHPAMDRSEALLESEGGT